MHSCGIHKHRENKKDKSNKIRFPPNNVELLKQYMKRITILFYSFLYTTSKKKTTPKKKITSGKENHFWKRLVQESNVC